MAGKVTFILDAEEGKAVGAFLKVVDSQKKAEKQFDRTVKKAGELSRVLDMGASSALRFAAGFAGSVSVLGTASAVIAGMDKVQQRNIDFQKSMTELMSLGNNTDNAAGVRKQVLDLSSSWGIASKEIIDAMFNLQSSTANLTQQQRDDLLKSSLQLAKVYGVQLPLALNATTKTLQIFGDKADDVSTIARKLAFLGDEGVLTFTDLAQQFPDLASAGQAMGATFNEMIAALVVATQRGGKTEKTFTGVRNVLLRLNEAEKVGIHLTGSLFDKLDQLKGLDGDALKKIFGDEAIATAANLINNVNELRIAIGKIDSSLPDIESKLRKRLADPATLLAEATRQFQQRRENATTAAVSDLGPGTTRTLLRMEAGRTQFVRDNPLLADFLPEWAVKGADLARAYGEFWAPYSPPLIAGKKLGLWNDVSMRDRGVLAEASALMSEGRADEAGALKLAGGAVLINGRVSNAADATDFLKFFDSNKDIQGNPGMALPMFTALQADRDAARAVLNEELRRGTPRTLQAGVEGGEMIDRFRRRRESEATLQRIEQLLGLMAKTMGQEAGKAAAEAAAQTNAKNAPGRSHNAHTE
jgi:TP901 family phage tail tape measure protein